MDDLEMYGGFYDGPEKAPTPTKTVRQSILAVALALGLGVGAVLLFQIHLIAANVGYLVWMAVTLGPSLFVALQVNKMMNGYHTWARFTVGVIVFFAVAVCIIAALEANHLELLRHADDD
jgi:hypothetical protein